MADTLVNNVSHQPVSPHGQDIAPKDLAHAPPATYQPMTHVHKRHIKQSCHADSSASLTRNPYAWHVPFSTIHRSRPVRATSPGVHVRRLLQHRVDRIRRIRVSIVISQGQWGLHRTSSCSHG